MTAPKEVIQRTDLSKGEFSPSGVENARCLRKFYYTKMLGMKVKQTPVALVFGICIHESVEKFYILMSKLKAKPTHQELVDIKIEVIQTFSNSWVKWGIMGDMKRNLETGVMTMNNYVDYYAGTQERFELCDIESDQWVAMPNGTMMLVKMDRVLNEGDLIILVDTKTTSGAITDYFFRGFENHLPTSLYKYTVEQFLGRCDYVQIDAIKVPPPAPSSVSAPFGRALFTRTDLQMEDAIQAYCSITDYIMSVVEKPKEEWAKRMYINTGECNSYGGCPFLPVCKHGLNSTVKVDFDIDTPRWVLER